MNETELSVITPEKIGEYDFAERILTTGNENCGKCLLVTRGSSGASLYRKMKKNALGEEYFEIDRYDAPAVESNHFADSTGCGDVFASSFFYRSISAGRQDYKASLIFANRIAGEKTRLNGVEELEKLKSE
jgi:sugar/nucleoside kinase (ribokinase family)